MLKDWFKALDLNRSTWDKYQSSVENKLVYKYENLKKLILWIFNDNKKQFGYRTITKKLKEYGYLYGERLVKKVMKEADIRALYVRKMMRKARLRVNQVDQVYPDLIQRKFGEVKQKYTVLYTDITYLVFKNRKAYKSTIIDGYTKEVIASDISFKASAKFVIGTLKRALNVIKQTKSLNGIIIHSDHGAQYTSKTWKRVCELNNLIISMGAKKSCADNIVIESYHSLLKKGTIHNNKYKNLEEYIEDVINWDRWYNSEKTKNSFLVIERNKNNNNFYYSTFNM